MSCWNSISFKSKQRLWGSLTIFTHRYKSSSFCSTSCRFIAITVSIVLTLFASRSLPCPVIRKHSASSRNATGLSWSTLVVVVSFIAFSQPFFLIVYYQSTLMWERLSSTVGLSKTLLLLIFRKVHRYLSDSIYFPMYNGCTLYICQIFGNMATNYSNLHLRLSPLPLSQEMSLIPLLFLEGVLSYPWSTWKKQ